MEVCPGLTGCILRRHVGWIVCKRADVHYGMPFFMAMRFCYLWQGCLVCFLLRKYEFLMFLSLKPALILIFANWEKAEDEGFFCFCIT